MCEGTVEEGRACNTQACIGKPPPAIRSGLLGGDRLEPDVIFIFRIFLGKERSRTQGPRGIVGLKRDNADDSNYGVVATQTGEIRRNCCER